MMQLKNILRLTKNIKDYNLFELVKKNSFNIKSLTEQNKNLKEEIEKTNNLLNSSLEDNKKFKEENEKIKQTCVNLSHDMLLISKAIGQIYILTERAVIEEGLDVNDILSSSKKKKEEYH